MGVTDKFSKAVTHIPGKSTWAVKECAAKEWAIALLDRLSQLNWGLSRAIIFDRDRKFVGQVWKEIFKALKIDLLYSTAWHPQTDYVRTLESNGGHSTTILHRHSRG